MPLHNKVVFAVSSVGLAAAVALGGLAIQSHRYIYELQGREGAQYFIRLDRLSDRLCYLPVGVSADYVASQTLAVDRCEP